MSSTEPETVTPAVPSPRAPEQAITPWSPAIPTQRGIRWLEDPVEPVRDAPPAGLAASPPRTRPRWLLVSLTVATVLVVVGAAAVVGITALAHRTMTVQGSIVVAGRGTLAPGSSCSVTTMPGRTVSVFGPDGGVVGSAALPTDGAAVDQWHTASPWADGCRFTFTVPDVPAGDDSYRVGLDGDAAGAIPFSHDELTSSGAQLTYGR